MDYVSIKKIKKYSDVVPILTDGPSERENKKYAYFTSTKLANRPLKKNQKYSYNDRSVKYLLVVAKR